MSVTASLDLITILLSNAQSCRRALSFSHLDLDCGTMRRCGFASSKAS